jgi:arginine decarboxylase
VTPDAAAWAGGQAFRADVGMNNGVDNRHQSWQVEPTAMQLFAKSVGADQTLFSTNGSSENVHVAMMAAVRPGETLVLARNGHKSAFAGLVLSGAHPVYVDPVYDERWQIAHGVDPASLGRVLRAHPSAWAVMMFTPTYYGVSADVKALAQICHAHGIPLLTDDAWGPRLQLLHASPAVCPGVRRRSGHRQRAQDAQWFRSDLGPQRPG